MKKFPFTPAGLSDLLTQLFALTDSQLQQQADQIGNNFKAFTAQHFDLSATQLLFLDSIDEKFITEAAQSCKSFVERRMMIGLIKDKPKGLRTTGQLGKDKDRGKLIDLDKKKTCSYCKEEGYQSSEGLTFIISYHNPL